MRIYGLEPQDVLFAFLIASGFSPSECCNVIYRPLSHNLKGSAEKVLRNNPTISKMADEIKAAAEPAITRKKTKKVVANIDKDTIVAELWQQASFAKEGKDKAEVYMKIADLLRLKQAEDKEKDKRVVYYLPLRCDVCPYKNAKTEKQKESCDE